MTWDWKGLSVTYGVTYLDAMALRSAEIEAIGDGPSFQFTRENGIASDVFIHDISFAYEVNDSFDVYGGVNNIFDRQPFVTEQAYPVSPVGTYFFLGLTARM